MIILWDSSYPWFKLLPFLSKSWFPKKSPLRCSLIPGQLTSEQCRGKSQKQPFPEELGFWRPCTSCWAFLTFFLKRQGSCWQGLRYLPQGWESSESPRSREASFGCLNGGLQPPMSHRYSGPETLLLCPSLKILLSHIHTPRSRQQKKSEEDEVKGSRHMIT